MFKMFKEKKELDIRECSHFNIPDWAKEIENNYTDIVRIYDEKYVVFLDKHSEIDWITSDEFDKALDNNEHGWKLVNTTCSTIRLIYTEIPIYTSSLIKTYVSLHLGEALVAAFDNNKELAENIINDVRKIVADISTQEARKLILLTCTYCIMYTLFGMTLVEINYHLQGIQFFIDYRKLILCFFIGAIGSVVSIFLKSTNIADNKKIMDKSALQLEVCLKILSGAIFGCLTLELSKAGMLPINNANNSAIYIFAFISGFVERFIPDFLEKKTSTITE